jgi:hypothetical protein
MPKSSASPSTLDRLDERIANLTDLVAEFRTEYKETTKDIRLRQDANFGEVSRKQDEQFAVVIKRISDIETWKATEIQPTRIMKWDSAAKKVDDYLDDQHVVRREKVFKAVEAHMDDNGRIENLYWLTRSRDRLGFLLAVVSTVLGVISGLFYWLLDNVILPFFNQKGG